MVELRTIAGKAGALVEDLAEDVLHGEDVTTDRQPAAQLLLQIGCGRKVIGMGVRFQQPFDLQPLLADIGDDGIGRSGGSAPRCRIEIEYAIDDCGLAGRRIGQHMGYSKGRFIEEAANLDRRRIGLLHDLCCGGNDGV